MKLEKLELSALLGLQARNRELIFMMEQVKLQLEQLNEESEELFSDIELRLKLEPESIQNYDVDIQTGELIPKKDDTEAQEFGQLIENTLQSTTMNSNGFQHSDITDLEDID